jgi:hypothetical protein
MLGPGPRSNRRGGIKFRTDIALRSRKKVEVQAKVEAKIRNVRSSLSLGLDLSLVC